MVRIDWIRHGEPDWAPAGTFVQDSPLSDLGRRQAQAAAETYASSHGIRLFASPLRRARETAAALEKTAGRDAVVLSWLEEVRITGYDGKPAVEAMEAWKAMMSRGFEDWWHLTPEGERWVDFEARIGAGLDGFLWETMGMRFHDRDGHRLYRCPNADIHVVMVAHAGTIGCAICHLMGLPTVPWVFEQFRSEYGAISRMETTPLGGGAIWALTRFNDRRHLEMTAT